jgi:hypothetical protein
MTVVSSLESGSTRRLAPPSRSVEHRSMYRAHVQGMQGITGVTINIVTAGCSPYIHVMIFRFYFRDISIKESYPRRPTVLTHHRTQLALQPSTEAYTLQ